MEVRGMSIIISLLSEYCVIHNPMLTFNNSNPTWAFKGQDIVDILFIGYKILLLPNRTKLWNLASHSIFWMQLLKALNLYIFLEILSQGYMDVTGPSMYISFL